MAAVAGWLGVVVVATTGVVSLSLVDQMVLLGIAVVLPLSVGGRMLWWVLAAAFALVSFRAPAGWAGVFVLPLIVIATSILVTRVRQAGPLFFWKAPDVVGVLAAAYALVAAGALLASRLGLSLFGVTEPIVELTAVHYMFAGAAALTLAGATMPGASGRGRRMGAAAVLFTAAAPPFVAVGFVTGAALPQVGGAVLMALGVWLTATLQLRAVVVGPPSAASALLGVSGLAVWVPMVLAVAWAGGQHWDIPVLSIPDMARTHGLANALAFSLCGLLGRHIQSVANVEEGDLVVT